MQAHILRSDAVQWAGELLRTAQALLHGSVLGQPGVYGQTRDEEVEEFTGSARHTPWSLGSGMPITFDAHVARLPNADLRLYGSKQLERLVAEFRYVASEVPLSELDADAVATATASTSEPPGSYQTLVAAADLAAANATALIGPLVETFFERGVAIVARVLDVAAKAHEANRALAARVRSAAAVSAFDARDFPAVRRRVMHAYEERARQLAAAALAKCQDDIKCFYFERTPQNFEQATVEQLADFLFKQLRARAIDNCILKFHCFFVRPCFEQLQGSVLGSLNTLSDNAVDEVFQTKAVIIIKKKNIHLFTNVFFVV